MLKGARRDAGGLKVNGFLHLKEFGAWINSTPLHAWARGLTAGTEDKALLAVQIAHVLGICLIAGTVGIFSLRMIGLIASRQPLAAFARRLLPWAWGAIVLQLVTGIFMVVERPERAMGSLTFPYKMLFLIAAIVVTIVFGATIRRDPDYWDRSGGRRLTARLLGAVSLALWLGVIFAGRWIAYERVAL
jgi:hypothetical protein